MKRFWGRVKAVPRWGWLFGIGFLALEGGVYELSAWLSHALGTDAWAFACKIPAIDDRIPLLPVFAVVYVYSYAFWVFGTAAVSLTRRRNFANYCLGLALAYLIGLLFFLFLPTRMDRVQEGLTAAAGPGLFDRLLALLYAADGRDIGFNLFPSFHCLASAYCYLGVRRQPEISRGFQAYSLVMAILISLSTVLTKQHYVIDIPGGWLLAIGCYALMNRIDPGRRWEEPRRR